MKINEANKIKDYYRQNYYYRLIQEFRLICRLNLYLNDGFIQKQISSGKIK